MSVYDGRLPLPVIATYGYLACHAFAGESAPEGSHYIGSPRGQFFMRRSKIAAGIHATSRTVDNHLRLLIEHGYLQRIHRSRDGRSTSSLFRLRLDFDTAWPPEDEFTRLAEGGETNFTLGGETNFTHNRGSTEQRSSLASPEQVQDAPTSAVASRGRAPIPAALRRLLAATSDRYCHGWDLNGRTREPRRLQDRWHPNPAHWAVIRGAHDDGIALEAEAAFRAFDDWVQHNDTTSTCWGAMLTSALKYIRCQLIGEPFDADDQGGGTAWHFDQIKRDGSDELMSHYGKHMMVEVDLASWGVGQ